MLEKRKIWSEGWIELMENCKHQLQHETKNEEKTEDLLLKLLNTEKIRQLTDLLKENCLPEVDRLNEGTEKARITIDFADEREKAKEGRKENSLPVEPRVIMTRSRTRYK
ncbi:hypothetical protein SNEBB_001628 [Seison nebaliae]|nr:hypothetical protein SNEBB_001628 [Seison nebaliae]